MKDMEVKSIAIGADHAGYEYKDRVKALLEEWDIDVRDFGTYGPDSVDYPDFVHPVASGVEAGVFQRGIVVCGSGNGVAMTANKHQGIRCALCWTRELAELARQHNDANILAIPARFIGWEAAAEMVKAFVHTEFEGGRHERRVNKISC